ncbi:MAG: ammonium transporter [Alphaproteobacteria bacterium]|nr:ammonium transporter [Alphaproteobacteria bacterium]
MGVDKTGKGFFRVFFSVFAIAFVTPALAWAADIPAISPGDTAWMLTATTLVLLMTIPGLAVFYGGMVRRHNVLSTVMQSFATACLVAVLWAIVGYSLAFTNGGTYIGDFGRILLRGMNMSEAFTLGAGTASPVVTTIPEALYMMFQMTFAIITPALIAGAFCDRIKFSAMLVFMGLWSLVVYAPVAHWVWHPNGFLAAKGVLDFAGGTVVHINAGVAGLVAAIFIGRRLHMEENYAPHNPAYSVVGASLLWVGWFGFNAGSALGANGRAAMAMTVTMIAAATAALSWMAVEWKFRGKPSVLGTITGAVSGLVVITPASGYVDASGALIIGALGGGLCFLSAMTVKERLKLDDSLDCFGVHGVGGMLGALLTGIFATSAISGVPSQSGAIEGNWWQLVLQLEGIGVTIVWCAIATCIILFLIDQTIGLRVSEEVEREGLDHALHGERLRH